MKKYTIYLIISSILLVMSACEKEAEDIELPQVDPKLVVYGYLSPADSLIEIEITKSVPVFGNVSGNIFDPVTDATVQISSEGKTVILPYSSVSQSYVILNTASFSIQEGKSYSLDVKAPGNFNVTSKTTVPTTRSSQIRIDIDSTIRNSDGFSEKAYRIVTRWNDIPNETNFYEASVGTFFNDSRNDDNLFNICSLYESDKDQDGQELSLSCTYTSFVDPNFPGSSLDGRVTLNNVDLAYYRYHESLSNYEGDNPFSEPARIYSNIEGGLGCFGSYTGQNIDF